MDTIPGSSLVRQATFSYVCMHTQSLVETYYNRRRNNKGKHGDNSHKYQLNNEQQKEPYVHGRKRES